MSTSTRTISLQHWAFEAVAKSDFNLLIDRCGHETIVVTRQGQPDLVMVSHSEWAKLNEATEQQARQERTEATRTEDAGHATTD